MSRTIKRFLPHLLVAAAIVSLLGVSYASVVASNSSPKVIWSTNPITISFQASTGSGSVSESFKCAPALANVVLTTSVNSPGKISLTVSPATRANCGPVFNTETLTATCLVSAALCKGSYTGTVTVHRTSQYGNTVPPSLPVTIIVN